MDGKFLLFRSTEHEEELKIRYLNSNTKTLPLHLKLKKNGSLLFLDIKISHEKNKFVTSVYRKPTFSGFFINFESCFPNLISVILLILYYIEGLFYAPVWKSFVRKLILWSQSSQATATLRTSSTYASKNF